MNREKAQEILKVYGRSAIGGLVFSRQTYDDIHEIESKSDEELVDNWKDLVHMNVIYGQVSLNEMQRISLINLEMDERKIPSEPLKSWYESESLKFNEHGPYGM
jgi:hypothetical protein